MSMAESLKLPVVGYWVQPAMNEAYFQGTKEDPTYCLTCKPLTYADDAQAQIDRLTRERGEAREWERQIAEQFDALETEFRALKSSAPSAERVMELADAYAQARVDVPEWSSLHFTEAVAAARAALLAELGKTGGGA